MQSVHRGGSHGRFLLVGHSRDLLGFDCRHYRFLPG
jgi:hypothetical protein